MLTQGAKPGPDSSQRCEPAWFSPRPSRLAIASWLLLHGFALANVWLACPSRLLALLLGFVLAFHGWLRWPRSCPDFAVLGDGSLRFRGSYLAWEVLDGGAASRYVVVVPIRAVGPSLSQKLRVYRDSLNAEQWRRLRALLNSRLVCTGSQKRKTSSLEPSNPPNFQRDRGSIWVPVREQTGATRGE